MASRFIKQLAARPSTEPLDLVEAQRWVVELAADLGRRIFDQEQMIRRVLAAQIIGKHMLIEGMPGEAKTTCVSAFAKSVGLRYRRVQFVPDMLPSDLIGSRQLQLDPQTGQPELVFRDGPLCAPIVVADEINRAPAKVQAAMLEVMAEKQISRLDQETSYTPYHPQDRAELAAVRQRQGECFGVPLPDPEDRSRVFQVVFATQNPVEQEGTYPLSEASLDRFTFKVVITPPSIEHYTNIARVNIFRRPGGAAELPHEDGATADPVPLWLKTGSFFQGIRDQLFDEQHGLLQQVLDRRPGLWDRVRLVVMLTHYANAEGDLAPGFAGGDLPTSLRTPHQDRLRKTLADWHRTASPAAEHLLRDVDALLTRPIFQYVERGSSPRGLIDWAMAAVAEAFLDGAQTVGRRHFRAAALDVLRHRVSLAPQAAAQQLDSTDLIHLLVQTLLPDGDQEAQEDQHPLLLQRS